MTEELDELFSRLDRLEREETEATADLEGLAEGALEDLARAYRRAMSLLEDYRDRATGSGDFGGYVEFRSKFSTFVEELDEELPHRDAFEAAEERVDRRRLAASDFDRAIDALEPVADVVDALEERRSIRDDLQQVRGELIEARDTLEARRDTLADLATIQPDALDEPVGELRAPIDRYNEAIIDAHRRFIRNTPAREVLATYRRLSHFALLDIEPPPTELETYFETYDVGEEPVPTVRDYLTYTRSKLAHYVEDAGRFATEVGHHSGYLDQLTPEPFRIDWPPPPRSDFKWQLRELIKAVDRFGDAAVVEPLRELQQRCREPDRYDQLRSAARLQSELDDQELELVRSGAVHEELESVTANIEAIDAAIAGE